MDAPNLRERRQRAGLTQRQLAQRSGLSQPAIAAIESGARRPSSASMARLDSALHVRPSILLKNSRDRVLEVLGSRGITDPRIFGSIARGDDTEDSDVDLLVVVPQQFDIFDKVLLVQELHEVLGAHVDVVPDDARGVVADRARSEAVPL